MSQGPSPAQTRRTGGATSLGIVCNAPMSPVTVVRKSQRDSQRLRFIQALRQLPDEGESGQTGADDHQPFGEQHSTCVAVVKGRAAGAELTVPERVGEKSPPETNRRAEWWLAGRISRSLPTRRGLSALIRLAILFRFGLTRIPFHRKQRRTKNGLSSDGGNLVL